MDEFALIREYFSQGYPQPAGLSLGVGDDASSINLDSCQLIQSLDTQVENIHFLKHAPADLIAQRALRCAVSDLAAMGAMPLSFHLSLSLPVYARQQSWLSTFSTGLKQAANELGIGLVGGDTTSSNELVIAILVQSSMPNTQHLLTRANAKEGDDIWLSGVIGRAHRALSEELINIDSQALSANVQAYYRPEIQLGLSQSLLSVASSCIDVSDGLLQDAQHIAQASNVNLEFDGDVFKKWLNLTTDDFWQILTGGDDYQLLFTANKKQRPNIESLTKKYAQLTRVGQVKVQKEELVTVVNGVAHQPEHLGFQHFSQPQSSA